MGRPLCAQQANPCSGLAHDAHACVGVLPWAASTLRSNRSCQVRQLRTLAIEASSISRRAASRLSTSCTPHAGTAGWRAGGQNGRQPGQQRTSAKRHRPNGMVKEVLPCAACTPTARPAAPHPTCPSSVKVRRLASNVTRAGTRREATTWRDSAERYEKTST